MVPISSEITNLSDKKINNVTAPLVSSRISCGFPSPADDYIETPLDLNELLVKKPAATFFARAKGDSMINAGIYDGDILIIDRSMTAQNNQIVLAVVNGEFTLKRLLKKNGKISLLPENPKYKPIEITEAIEFSIWGVATNAIHKLI